MGLDRLWVSGHHRKEGSLRTRQILLPEVERTERQLELRLISQIGSRRLEAADGGVEFLAGGGHAGRQRERVEIVGLPLENEVGLLPSPLAIAPEQINGPELEPQVEVIRGQLLRFQEVRIRLLHLAQVIVR